VVLHRLGEWQRWLPAAATAIALFALAPISRDAAAAWGPGGFYRVMTQRDLQHMSAWLATLRPQARNFFWAQVHHDSHMTRR
jgi:hypothetical protein